MEYIVSLLFAALYIAMQATSVYAGDSGELVSSAWTWGISHPPGYPLFNLLGGIIAHGIRLSTPAWRVGLLSSLPMAGALLFLAFTVRTLTGRTRHGIAAMVTAGFLYPVWLYAVVPEVFGLYALFSAVLLYLGVRIAGGKSGTRDTAAFSLIAGLSLAHHHLIVLLFAAVAVCLIWDRRVMLAAFRKRWLVNLGLAAAGFSFYAYAPIVSSFNPPFDREHPAQLSGFIAMLFRTSYGTFKASYGTGNSMGDRWLNMFTFVYYVWRDFTPTGVGLVIAGLVWSVRAGKAAGRLIATYFAVLVFFLFYAGFSVNSDFALGTLERFFIVPYFVAATLAGLGYAQTEGWIIRRFARAGRTGPAVRLGIAAALFCLCGLIAVTSVASHGRPIAALKNDRTLERMTADVFAGVPKDGIMMLSDDTTDFAAGYSYFVLGQRLDIRYIHHLMLREPYYRNAIRVRYPDLVFPAFPKDLSFSQYLTDFFRLNSAKKPVFAERPIAGVEGEWVPQGMLVRYYPSGSHPDIREALGRNTELWQSFSDPAAGVLGRYTHMLLTDVLRVYSDKRLMSAAYLLEQDAEDVRAAEFMRQAVKTAPLRQESYEPLLLWDAKHHDCREAQQLVEQLVGSRRFDAGIYSAFNTVTESCPGLKELTGPYLQDYQKLRERSDVPLQ